jgi:trehalose 6-phosphate synthase
MQKTTKNGQGRLLVVANRLPVTISQQENGQFDFTMASGGLVSGLQSLSKTMEFQWFGWPGTEIHRNDQDTVKDQLATRFHAVPVFLSTQAVKHYYSGFSSESST